MCVLSHGVATFADLFQSIHFTLAYYAYALGRPSDCLSHLAQVPDFSQIQQFIPNTTRSNASNLLTIPAAPSASSSVTGGFSSFVDTSAQEVRDGRGWALTETFRSLCLQGAYVDPAPIR